MALSDRLARARGILSDDSEETAGSISGGRASRSRFGKRKSSKLDPSTVAGLEEIARRADIPVPEQVRDTGPSLIQKLSDFLSTGGFAIGGLIAGESPITGIKEKISPSEGLKRQGIDVTGKVKIGPVDLGELATDVLLDPTTYVTLGTGGVAKATLKGGAQAIVTKAGAKAIGREAEMIAVKTAAELARKGTIKPVEQITKEIVDQGLKGEGFIGTRVQEILERPGMTDLGGIKIGGQTVISGKTVDRAVGRPFRMVVEGMRNTPAGKDFVDGVEKFGSAIGKTFYRDYGLPPKAVRVKQQYLDQLNAATEKSAFEAAQAFKGLNEKDGRLLFTAREAGANVEDLPIHLREPYENFISQLDQTGLDLQQRGIINPLDDYVPHKYLNPPEEVRKAVTKYREARGIGSKPGFAQERVLPNLQEAEALGLKPDYNIARVYTKYMTGARKAMLEQDMLDTFAKMFPQDIPKGVVRDAGDTLVNYKAGDRMVRMPLKVAEDLKELGKKAIDDTSMNVFFNGYDRVLNFWKNTQTSMFPAFHGRNFLSNVANSALDIGVQSLNPAAHKTVIGIMRGAAKGGKFGKTVIKDAFGRAYSEEDIWKLAKEKGVITSSFGEMDIQQNVTATLKENMSKLAQYSPMRVGRKVGQAVENEARLVNFISNLRRGLDPDDAADSVKRFLFDYDNLSKTEKEVFRRFIPFYTFSRKNIELQMRTLLKSPGVIGGELKAITNAGNELTEEDKLALPDWIKNKVQIAIGRNEEGPRIVYGTGLPVEDVIDKLFPVEGGHVRSLVNQSSFIAKFALEKAFGFDTFRGENIEDLTDAADLLALDSQGILPDAVKELVDYKMLPSGKAVANPQWLHALRSVPFSRLGPTTRKLMDSESPTGEKMMEFITGLKIYGLKTEKAILGKEYDRLNEIAEALERANIIGNIRFVKKDAKKELVSRREE